ncbi:MAG: hypothetical protein ONB44_07705 [candidate division KSB1 bacterium]|nr:hypothetical protein [candidate division KSB1 bacterium]MDZ7302012.1 hypothetical protein [candidate division KSB1 bacterium]MDZ7310194.1 hypothetical protein [candidate division KSB1 bacterium]
MTEVTVKLPVPDSVKDMADKQFEGNLTALLNTALEFYLSTQASAHN